MPDGRGAIDLGEGLRRNVRLVLFVATAALIFTASQTFAGIATFAADCTTPKTVFNLGETVCATATGVPGLRFQWVNPDGFEIATSAISGNVQNNSQALPSTGQSIIGGFFTANNLGHWRINAITDSSAVDSTAFFTVKDPNNARVDLSIFKSSIGSVVPVAGDSIQFVVSIVNNGPNDAVNTHFVDNTFSNATFNSLSQTSGPAFTCSGGDCHIANFANGAMATFLVTLTAGGSGGALQNTAVVTSDTLDLNPADNTNTSSPVTVGTTGTPPTCNLVVTAPPSVTLLTGAGATSCGVVVNDLDTTLGTATATDTCPLSGSIVRTGVPSGNNFPVGSTILTYTTTDSDGNTASAIQQVVVHDNTPPVISCPPNVTLEPTCPTGAVATWIAPVGTDNCAGATTAQSPGPTSGSVFPIGTTPVVYTVTDASGNQSSCSFNVTVLTVAATIQNLESNINLSSLSGTQKQGLLPKLDAVLDAFNRGNTHASCGPLTAFVNAVQSLVAAGNITAAQGQAWILTATHLENTIGCTNNPCS